MKETSFQCEKPEENNSGISSSRTVGAKHYLVKVYRGLLAIVIF